MGFTDTLLPLIIAVLIGLFIWGLFKRIIKVVIYAGVTIAVLIFATSYVIYQDVNDLKENFNERGKQIILLDDQSVLTGFNLEGDTTYLDQDEIESYSALIQEENYDDILGDSYRLLIFDLSIIDALKKDTIEIGTSELTKEEAKAILRSGDPLALLQQSSIDAVDIELAGSDSANSDAVKAAFFSHILTQEVFSSKNPLFFFNQFKQGTITVYPETALFKTVKFIPTTFFKKAATEIVGKTKETVEVLVVDN